jgi:hypothetical protein
MRNDNSDPLFEPPMPPLELPYLVDFLWQVGPVIEDGNGRAPLTHQEIVSWQFNTGISLKPWEARFLRNLSRDFLAQSQKAEKPDCPSPFGFGERRAMVAKKVEEIFG